ncbi:MAG: hypothetical protein K2P92_01960 [Bdellovibrionaceae bacterium]|nr:hypothetical protein [Pseudobdellovibrionaceae bacterium]
MTRILLASVFCFFNFHAFAQTAEVAPANPPSPSAQPQKKMSVRKDPVYHRSENNSANYTTDALFISKAGEIGISGQLAYISGYLDFNGTSNATFDGFLSNFSAQYGIESYLNLYLSQGYTNYTTTSDSNPNFVSSYKGIGDTTFGAKGSFFLTPGFLMAYDGYYRAGLLAKAENDDSKANESSSTAVSERPRVGLSATFVALIDSFSLGFFAEGQFFQEGSYNSIVASGNRTATQSAGTSSSFNVFAQYDFGAKIGAAFLISNQDPYDVTINNTKTHNPGGKSNGVRVYGLLPLGAFEIGAGLTKPNYTNTSTPVTTHLYLTDAFVRGRF